MIEHYELEWYIHLYRKIGKVATAFGCSIHSIRKYIYKYNIIIPIGFYSTGAKIGRPKGIPMKEAQKVLFSKMFNGKNNPMFGKKHSKKTRVRMSKNHADFSGNKNPFKKSLEDETKLAAHKKRCKDTWLGRDKEWRNTFSEKLSRSLATSRRVNNKDINKHHKSGHINTIKAGRIFVRSSWEKVFAEFLDNLDIVESFSLEEFTVLYYLNSQKRHSRIDFLVHFDNGCTAMFEIKPKNLLKYKNNMDKVRGYRKYCEENNIEFSLITEKLLFSRYKLFYLLYRIYNKYEI